MPQYGKFEITRLDAAGNPISGATITIYKQGATVVSGGPTSFTVDDPGGIVAPTDTVIGVSADGLTERASSTVSSITATNVTTAGSITSMVNNDRLVPTTAGPSTFKDAQGNEASGAITTDTNGFAQAWVEVAPYDIKSVGGTSPLGSALTIYRFDVAAQGSERILSNAFMTGSQVIRRRNTLRALTSGDKFVSYLSAGGEKWYVGVNAGLNPVVPAHNVAGLLTIDSGGLTVTSGGGNITGGLTLATSNLTITTGGIIQSSGIVSNSLPGAITTSALTATAAGGVTASGGSITCSGGDIILSGGRFRHRAWAGFTDLDTTPSVSARDHFQCAYSAPTSISNFDDGLEGQEITIWFSNANVITLTQGASTLRLAGGVFTSTTGDTITFVADNSTPSVWYEKARSVNT